MEICVRLNDDCESDYTFQVTKDDTFESKIMKMFDRDNGLASFMVLRPSIFYNPTPKALTKSMHPGYLTENGCLIFHYDSDRKQYRESLDLDKKKIWEQMWPGQLVLPQWELSGQNICFYIAVMLAWLYTDLPDVISPTPGICLTNQLSKRLVVVARWYGYNSIADKLLEEIQVNSAGTVAQWLFFALHCFKVLFITLVFYTGLVNPLTYNIFRFYNTRKAVVVTKRNDNLKEVLRSIGWIGAKRATYDDYRDTYYNYRLQKAGGLVPAYKSGVMKAAATPGVVLENGEGFQTPLDKRFTESTFKTMEKSRKFVLSEEYLIQLEKDLKENIKKCDGDVPKINQEIRQFRRFGLFECGPELTRLVQLRQEVAAEALAEAEAAAKAKAATDPVEKKTQ
ncbi:LANO_0F15082g1_1 [Lachancea nothofagi CBS 11611]|uniref:LANO_0F15082g1_1 n=1 Tax=Lachancea nothofagi CBS 11611 TaxID=1266666 RepID=A0A1G4KCF3_9SACH|nr:LANO_0F15082g1_1 [Lachancea nothofagi CBS 11611]